MNSLKFGDLSMKFMTKRNNDMETLKDLVDVLTQPQSGSVGHSLSHVFTPP